LKKSESAFEDYQSFIDEMQCNDIVWGIYDGEHWGAVQSLDFPEREVLLFWSSEERARLVCIDEWSDYEPKPIRFDEFIDEWLSNMHEDRVLVGVNWGSHLEGAEQEALLLMDDLLDDEEYA